MDLPSNYHKYSPRLGRPPRSFRAKRQHLKRLEELLPGSQGQHLAVTVLYVAGSLDSGAAMPARQQQRRDAGRSQRWPVLPRVNVYTYVYT